VPRFEPFAGVRYDVDRFALADVTAPPYDVLSSSDRAALCARSDHNVVCIDLPTEHPGVDQYSEAGEVFDRWRGEGALVTDPRPAFTIYCMDSTDDHGRPATTLGVIGALELSRPGEGAILPHELTTPKARSDRLDLLRGTRANLSAVWGLSLATGLSELLVGSGEPVARWTDDDAVQHSVWTVDSPGRIEAIAGAVAGAPVVIADGHHRYETCLTYRDERRATDGPRGPADATMCFVVELVEDQLSVRPIHRLLTDLPPDLDVRSALAAGGLVPSGAVELRAGSAGQVLSTMQQRGELVLVEPDRATFLRPDPATFVGVADLDSARLAHALGDLPPITVAYQHGVDHIVKAVTSGHAQAGVLLRPATVAQIAANAHSGERMPPKTTFFHPKPKTGIVFRDLA